MHPKLCEIDRKAILDDITRGALLLKDQFEEYVFALEHIGYSLGKYLDGMSAFAEELDQQENRKPDGLARATAKCFSCIINFDDDSTSGSSPSGC